MNEVTTNYITTVITLRGKLLNADWSKKRVSFFLYLLFEEGKITRSRLVLRLPSGNGLFNREVGCLSVMMASRSEGIYRRIKDNSENENTKNSTECSGERTFSKSGRMEETMSSIDDCRSFKH